MSEVVDLSDLASKDFPHVSPHAIKASKVTVAESADGFNPDIHASPARRTKSGGWALKSGNKKGFVVGQKKIMTAADRAGESSPPPQSPPANEPPPLNVPPSPEVEASAAESVRAAGVDNRAAAKVVSQTLFGVGVLVSGYMPDTAFAAQYEQALATWFEEMGGVQVKAWVNVALLSGVYGVNLVKARKPQSWLDKMRGKIAAWWVNRRNSKKGYNGTADERSGIPADSKA